MAVIKRSDAGGDAVRSLDRPRTLPRAPVAEVDPLAAACESLRGEVARLERRIATMTSEAEDAIAAARTAGHASGLAAADTREGERVAAVAAGLTAQRTALDARFEALDGLAAALARGALARLFDRPEAMAEMVAATIARNIDLLRAQAATGMRVSAADFASPDALAGIGDGSVTIEVDDGLPAGTCRISCRLGDIDLDVPQQWGRIADALDRMADAA